MADFGMSSPLGFVPTLRSKGLEPQPPLALNLDYRRLIARFMAISVALVLHGGVYFWYVNRPVPLPFAAAAPLPMISMELSAPATPVTNQPIAPPQPVQPQEPKKLDPKPVKKIKPKLPKRPTAVKQVETQPTEPQTAAPSAAAPQTEHHQAMASPHYDTYIAANADAAYLNNPKPEYPLVATQRHWQGTVYLRVYVTAEGNAGDVKIQHSSGHEVLDESALEAVRKWRFTPAKRGEFAEASWATVPIEFELE